MSPGLISSAKPAASNTVSIFATRPVCGDSERAFMYHTFDPITAPLSLPRLPCCDSAGLEPRHGVSSAGTSSEMYATRIARHAIGKCQRCQTFTARAGMRLHHAKGAGVAHRPRRFRAHDGRRGLTVSGVGRSILAMLHSPKA